MGQEKNKWEWINITFLTPRHVQENLKSDNKYFVHLFKRPTPWILRIYVTQMNHKSLRPEQLLTNTAFSFSIAAGYSVSHRRNQINSFSS